ncbi:MAG: 50S ribosomal protein L18 [bacterium]|nr:MAG: 50S ribosomal protein L18 [bacterium]
MRVLKDVRREKRRARIRRHRRIRKRVSGTAERPRLCVFRSLNHIYAQIINDEEGKTIVSASSRGLQLPPEGQDSGEGKKDRLLSVKMRRSIVTGKAIAERALEKGITEVAFDRGGYLYHGRVAALAEAARKAGLVF